ncbi:acetyl-CoA carboxylase biotin carboxylase subunit [Desulfococcaceae bacterium OttesenSCG-928-F15]|nr:acetyl-CoA carboxylase biotin carboxylase subunit [Desulfococcaceae bacterium OttesenSCG-928-F15]
MFKKILIANRGEIAVRVIHTCREMGIATVSVYSDADRWAAHVLAADEAVYLGPSEASKSYLAMEKILDAAKKTKAEAIHPGYGFLAENADFAELCEKNGLVFIGPPAGLIRDLGDKTRARAIMAKGGVPITPGTLAPEADPEALFRIAEDIGYPVVIKASAGGGGKGMRIVHHSGEMREAFLAASGEAKSAFGNGAVYLEKYIQRPRHIEFQILADSYGNVIHLLERECSIQRRYQKIIEETPSSAMTQELREKMGEAAINAAKTAGYVNAGTVEFLLDQDGSFYFLEVNTRLQVEHPITEMVTGIDLVRQQILISAGEKLRLRQEEISARGHAIECRIYAEDPQKAFMPSPGKISFLKEPTGPGIRNDCGVYSGFEVPMYYDPILSKLIAHAENRKSCIRRMLAALEDYVILGIRTPIPFLMDVLRSEAFSSGETYTDFIPSHFADWQPEKTDKDLAAIAFIAGMLKVKSHTAFDLAEAGEPPSPWQTLGHWRS